MRRLIVVLGDQLNPDSAVFDGADPDRDVIWMAELAEEVSRVPSHKLRIAVFLAAMRHYRDAQREAGWRVEYHALTSDPAADRASRFENLLAEDLERWRPEGVVVVRPGDLRVQRQLESAAAARALSLEIRPDRHFYLEPEQFAHWASGRKGLLLEHFYRWMRQREGVLMDGKSPAGGRWNYDHDNRKSFGRGGPAGVPLWPAVAEGDVERSVRELIEARFADHPGELGSLGLPLTPQAAGVWLEHFIEHRLALFGDYQDALWAGEPFLYHSRLSVALNLHLLDPRDCVAAAERAYRDGQAPLNAVEAFIRQILGWREFIRGVYWLYMPGYAERNALEHEGELPGLYWHGETDMACLRDAMAGVLAHGYAHHIQRLMVLGLFAQLYGVHPYRFHDWHMAMYVDAVDWVSLPNTLGMSQFGDGGVVGTKPYCASGRYIQKMSNHCRQCRFRPEKAVGADACPFTTLYWAFLDRHAERFQDNRRMAFQMKNLRRKEENGELPAIRAQAARLRRELS